jgi:hypothetical protein
MWFVPSSSHCKRENTDLRIILFPLVVEHLSSSRTRTLLAALKDTDAGHGVAENKIRAP